jgi:hypothetical protein
MLKRFIIALLFAGFALPAFAVTDYSDMWFIPAESGWGVNLTQNENVIFVTFFIYGPDNQPKWYVATTVRDANGNFTGSLYSTVGTYFGLPWKASDWAPTLAGTATFAPVNPYQGTLTYTLLGGPTVVKSIVRETLVAITLTGNYTGGQAGGYSGCSNSGDNFLYKDTFDLQVSQGASNIVLTFSYPNAASPTLTCSLSGAVVQNGQLSSVPSASYQCDDGLNTTASLSEIKKTGQGIEGRLAAPSVGLGCREDASFSAVNLVP